jgi:hypothetical protein
MGELMRRWMTILRITQWIFIRPTERQIERNGINFSLFGDLWLKRFKSVLSGLRAKLRKIIVTKVLDNQFVED